MTFDPYLVEYRHCINGITKSDAKNLKKFPQIQDTINRTTASKLAIASNVKVNVITPTLTYLEGNVGSETIRFMRFPNNNTLGTTYNILEKFDITVRYDNIVFRFPMFDAWENREYSKLNATSFVSTMAKDSTYTYVMYFNLIEFFNTRSAQNQDGRFNVYIDKITNTTGERQRIVQEVSIGGVTVDNKWGITYYYN